MYTKIDTIYNLKDISPISGIRANGSRLGTSVEGVIDSYSRPSYGRAKKFKYEDYVDKVNSYGCCPHDKVKCWCKLLKEERMVRGAVRRSPWDLERRAGMYSRISGF